MVLVAGRTLSDQQSQPFTKAKPRARGLPKVVDPQRNARTSGASFGNIARLSLCAIGRVDSGEERLMLRRGLGIIAVIALMVVVMGSTARAQEDADGDGLYEVCVLTWAEMGGRDFSFAEVSAEEMEAANYTHVLYYAANPDGTCPPEEEAVFLRHGGGGESITPEEEAELLRSGGSGEAVEPVGELPIECGLRAGEQAPYTEGSSEGNDFNYTTGVDPDVGCPEGIYELVEVDCYEASGPCYAPVPVGTEQQPSVEDAGVLAEEPTADDTIDEPTTNVGPVMVAAVDDAEQNEDKTSASKSSGVTLLPSTGHAPMASHRPNHVSVVLLLASLLALSIWRTVTGTVR